MALTFPLTLPTTAPRHITFRARSTVGRSLSPFSRERQIYVHQGEWWEADVQYDFLTRATADDLLGFLVALNGMEGTFTFGDPVNTTVRGTWAGTPVVAAAGAALGIKTVPMSGFTAGATVKRGDWIQTGSGSATHLHKVTADATADGSGLLTLEIWPRLRVALVSTNAFTIASPVGLWTLASNDREWSLEVALQFGITFSCVEAL